MLNRSDAKVQDKHMARQVSRSSLPHSDNAIVFSSNLTAHDHFYRGIVATLLTIKAILLKSTRPTHQLSIDHLSVNSTDGVFAFRENGQNCIILTVNDGLFANKRSGYLTDAGGNSVKNGETTCKRINQTPHL